MTLVITPRDWLALSSQAKEHTAQILTTSVAGSRIIKPDPGDSGIYLESLQVTEVQGGLNAQQFITTFIDVHDPVFEFFVDQSGGTSEPNWQAIQPVNLMGTGEVKIEWSGMTGAASNLVIQVVYLSFSQNIYQQLADAILASVPDTNHAYIPIGR